MPAFELSKWYADCISEQGEAAIIYHAKLRWRAVTIHYASMLKHGVNSPTDARFSLLQRGEPTVLGDTIRWNSPELQAEGTWSEAGESQQNLLFEGEGGSLDWNCIAPRAKARIKINSEPTLHGWGYVEHLRLSLPPWRLPIRRLRWGRFVNAADALVWIDWSGPYNKQVVYLNGAAVSTSVISDDEVVVGQGEAVLSLESKSVIRDGRLGSTALSVLPHLERLFPDSILNIRECKWLSGAVLRRPGLPDSTGFAIHEVVEWP